MKQYSRLKHPQLAVFSRRSPLLSPDVRRHNLSVFLLCCLLRPRLCAVLSVCVPLSSPSPSVCCSAVFPLVCCTYLCISSAWIWCTRDCDYDSGAAVTDVNEQQLDLRSKNSWMLKLGEVCPSLRELLPTEPHSFILVATDFSPPATIFDHPSIRLTLQ